MSARYFKKMVYLFLFIPSLCAPLTTHDEYNMISAVHINQSVYSIDKKLIHAGFKIENINNQAVLMYQNKPITAEAFYMPGIEGDQALKLYIEISNTIKNAMIYLNNEVLQQKTNAVGAAYIDLHRAKGRYHLKLKNSVTQNTNNYYFELDKPLKLLCHGTNEFDCKKIYY